jgi:hypothetical protein
VFVNGLALIVDLHRPERFWHMLLKSEVTRTALAEGFPFSAAGWRLAVQAPAFKYWSPMSASYPLSGQRFLMISKRIDLNWLL